MPRLWPFATCHPGQRSLDRAYRALTGRTGAKRRSKQWSKWSSEGEFVARAEAWDREKDRRKRAKLLQAQLDAAERHARLAAGTLTTLSAPIRALLEVLQDPTAVERMTQRAKASAEGLEAMLHLAVRVASAIPALVQVERLALGMTTDRLEIAEAVEPDRLSGRIVADPVATDLAIALLDRCAGTATKETSQ